MHKNKMNYHLNKVNLFFDIFILIVTFVFSFFLGEVFTKIEDEDDQGWCKGRVGNRIGLYPATYVEAL
jgi:hypothetical protein